MATIFELLANPSQALESCIEEWQQDCQQDPGIEADGTPAKAYTLDEYIAAQVECMQEDGVRNSDDALSLAFYMVCRETRYDQTQAATQAPVREA